MFAEDPTYLQEAEIAEVDPLAEAVYDGYAEAEPFAGYGEYYPPPSYGVQFPRFTPPGFIRRVWSQMENRFITYRWNVLLRRWDRLTPRPYGGYPGSPYGPTPYPFPGAAQPYGPMPAYPGMPNPGAPAFPGQPGYPGMPGMPGMPGYPAAGGGGRRRRRRRR